jgi:hypothetical protein
VALKVVPEVIELGTVFLGQLLTNSISIYTQLAEKVSVSSQLVKVVYFEGDRQQVTVTTPSAILQVYFKPNQLGRQEKYVQLKC